MFVDVPPDNILSTINRFDGDVRSQERKIREAIAGKRVLVIGGAGSIGSSTTRLLAGFRPSVLHVIDQNENGLTELVRDFRTGGILEAKQAFGAWPIDFGSAAMYRFLRDNGPYDEILNFAAIKHVRSEKDVYALAQMFDTNVVKQWRFLRWLSELSKQAHYFSVSTDKAANPVNLMGASKRIMEHVILRDSLGVDSTSARFANVAFSSGSLLESFLIRIQKRQPIGVPRSTKRYFLTMRDAGQICLLAATVIPVRHLLIPRFNADDLRELEPIAVAVLQHHGFKPRFYEDEALARRGIVEDVNHGLYPVLLTPLDTSGEKSFEEFVGKDEHAEDIGLSSCLTIRYDSQLSDADMTAFLCEIERFVNDPKSNVSKPELVSLVASIVPDFSHVETGKNLDQRI